MASIFKRKGKGTWIIHYFDHLGRRREKSTGTTDKRAAQRIVDKLVAGVALRKEGVIDPKTDRLAEENSRPIQSHVSTYLDHLGHAGRSPLTIRDARWHLAWILKEAGATRLADLTLDAVERALGQLQAADKSARTVNFRGGSVRTFLNWCVKTGRLDSNPLRHLPRQNEARDRRRERRALTDNEVARLLAVGEEHGRTLWYLLPLLAGLRLSDLKRLKWGDIDFDRRILTIREGKAKRVDEVPLHPDLAAELLAARPAHVMPQAPVFATAVTNVTRQRDFKRAGIPLLDEEGRSADLHALRTTLATKMARNNVPPQVAQRIMRHSDYRTTLRHYTRLELTDDQAAMDAVSFASAPAEKPERSAAAQ